MNRLLNFIHADRYRPVYFIAIITLFVYSQALWFDFVNYDDPIYVTQNPNIQSGITYQAIITAFTEPYEVNWIPLTWLSHMLDMQLFGLNPAEHHAVNLLFHAASASILFLFLHRTTGLLSESLMVALLFSLHPLRVESVAWVAERKDVLSAFFGMLTLHSYQLYTENRTFMRYLAVLFLFILGLMAKPMLITLPVVLLLIDWWHLRMMRVDESEICSSGIVLPIKIFAEKLPLFALSVCAAFITIWAQSSGGNLTQGYTVAMRAYRAFISYMTYLWMMVWPVDLAVIYPFSKYPPTQLKIYSCLLALVLLTLIAFRLRNRYPYLLFGWLWYVITIFPVVGFIQIGHHSVADRYTYIPSIGIFIILIWGVSDLSVRYAVVKKITSVTALPLVVLLIIMTLLQLRHWKDSYSLFSHAVAVTDGNWVAHHNLALSLLYKNMDDEALDHFYLSIKAKPSYALPHIGIGALKHKRKEYAASIEAYKYALMFEPQQFSARMGLGLVYIDIGDKAAALSECRIMTESGSPDADELREKIVARFGPVKENCTE